jgi:protease I
VANELRGRTVAFLATDGVEQVELTAPWDAVRAAGAETHLIALQSGTIQGMNNDTEKGDTFSVDRVVSEADAADYDALVLPGGIGYPDKLRTDADAVRFVKAFFLAGKPVGSICHGPWTIIEADMVRGRTLTSWPSLQTDIRNAGGEWVDKEVQTDNGLVTSRNPDDLPAFCKKIVEEFAEGRHESQAQLSSAEAGTGIA